MRLSRKEKIMELKFRNLTKDEIEVRLGGGGSITSLQNSKN